MLSNRYDILAFKMKLENNCYMKLSICLLIKRTTRVMHELWLQDWKHKNKDTIKKPMLIYDGKLSISKTMYVFIFQLLGECHCWWTKESPRAHVAKFYGRLRLICSVWEHQNFPC